MGKIFTEEIKRYRKTRNLTQKQLGELIGKTESSIQKYEAGKTEIPLNVLERIASALDVEIYDFMTVRDLIDHDNEVEKAILSLLDSLGYKVTTQGEDYLLNNQGYHYKVKLDDFVFNALDTIRFQAQYAMDKILEKAEKID